jgi:lysozyme
MARQIEIFPEGLVCEFEDKQPVELTKTNGRIDLLLKTLEFSLAETFTLAPPDAIPPDIPVSRAPLRQINGEGLKLLQTFEGLYLEAYKDPVGVWTIGWGCTEGICEGMKITKAQAESMLKKELVQFEAAVAKAVEVEINDNQYSALISFSYNLGVRSLFESTLLKYLNQGNYQEAADQFLVWDKAQIGTRLQVLPGLARRRRAERSLFLSESWEWARYWEPDRVLRLAESGQPLVQGDDVLQVQKALIKAGFEIQADGFFGLETDQKIRQFQQQKELTIDGVVGAETLKALGL